MTCCFSRAHFFTNLGAKTSPVPASGSDLHSFYALAAAVVLLYHR